jgi:hypothetical protein
MLLYRFWWWGPWAAMRTFLPQRRFRSWTWLLLSRKAVASLSGTFWRHFSRISVGFLLGDFSPRDHNVISLLKADLVLILSSLLLLLHCKNAAFVDPHWFQWIQHFRLNADPYPWIWWQKMEKLHLKKDWYFWPKIALFLLLGLQKDVQATDQPFKKISSISFIFFLDHIGPPGFGIGSSYKIKAAPCGSGSGTLVLRILPSKSLKHILMFLLYIAKPNNITAGIVNTQYAEEKSEAGLYYFCWEIYQQLILIYNTLMR